MGDWLPIESAPRDGTAVLVWATRVGWEATGFKQLVARYDEYAKWNHP